MAAASPPPKRPSFLIGAALAVLAGTIQFLAFPGIDLWPLAFLTLVPLFFALEMTRDGVGHTTRAVIGIGMVFGLVGNLGGFYWLIGMLERFSGFPFIACLFFALVICAYQGGMFAFFGWLWFVARRRGWPSLLAAPLAFGAVELVWPLLFPYYQGNHLHSVPALIQIADLGGPILVTMLVVIVNAAIHGAAKSLFARTRVAWRDPLIAAACVGATLVYGVVRIAQVDEARANAPALTVGMVQANMGIFSKREDPEEGLRRHVEDSIALQQREDIDLLVWPESAYNWLLRGDATNVKPYVMGEVEGPLLFGGLQRRHIDGETRLYNTAFLVDREGEILGTYDKTYLLAFGEYLPFGDVFPVLYDWSPNSGRFTPGDHVHPLELDGYRITALVCYEDILPAFTRRAVREGDPHLLVNMTNDAWFGDTTEPWQHLALAKFRAIEHHRYLVRSTNSGVSAIVDPVGRVVVVGGVFTRETLHATVHMMNGWTVYQSVGDWPGWLGLLGILFLCFVRKAPPRAAKVAPSAADDERAHAGEAAAPSPDPTEGGSAESPDARSRSRQKRGGKRRR